MYVRHGGQEWVQQLLKQQCCGEQNCQWLSLGNDRLRIYGTWNVTHWGRPIRPIYRYMEPTKALKHLRSARVPEMLKSQIAQVPSSSAGTPPFGTKGSTPSLGWSMVEAAEPPVEPPAEPVPQGKATKTGRQEVGLGVVLCFIFFLG